MSSVENVAVESVDLVSETHRLIHAPSVKLTHEPVSAEQSIAGDPSTATTRLGEIFGAEFGLWEMSAGTMTDIEAEELFVVLSGTATVLIHEASGFAASELHLKPGSICQLSEGMHTTWVLDEPLRKIYLVAAD